MTKVLKNLWVCVFDSHYPKVHRPTKKALFDFVKRNKERIAGFYWGGDQEDNEEISHHNEKRLLLRVPGSYARNTVGFDRELLTPIEGFLPGDCRKIWQIGNHDDWENQLVEKQPELLGTVERPILLRLEERGWEVLPCGSVFRLGKLLLIHGETLTGIGNQGSLYHAKRAVEAYGCSILYGHIHAPQSFTRIAPYNQTDRHMAWCSPILGNLNPGYLRNRPTAWVHGFTVVETLANGNFNVYPIIVSGGRFSFGGVVYGDDPS